MSVVPQSLPVLSTPAKQDSALAILDSVLAILDSALAILDSALAILDSVLPILDSVLPILDSVLPILDSSPSRLLRGTAAPSVRPAVVECSLLSVYLLLDQSYTYQTAKPFALSTVGPARSPRISLARHRSTVDMTHEHTVAVCSHIQSYINIPQSL